jgi:hypothetical protein
LRAQKEAAHVCGYRFSNTLGNDFCLEGKKMRRLLLALAIVALFASSAFAVAWPDAPALIHGPLYFGTYTGSFVYGTTDISVGQPYYPTPGVPATLLGFDPGASPVNIGQDYTVSAKIRFDTAVKTELGVQARYDVNNNTMYEASLNPNNGGYFILNSISALVPTKLGTTDGTVANFDINKDYVISLTVQGYQVAARCYEADGTTLLKEIIYDDSPGVGSGGHWAGTGLRTGGFSFVASGASGVAGHYLDHSVTLPVPEPGAAAILIAGALALLGWAGLHRRRG